MDNQKYDNLFKLLIVGDSGVGKTCVITRFTNDSFTDKYKSTSGLEFKNKIVNVDNKSIKLQIWDTSGMETSQSYYKGALGIIVTYDITDDNSFNDVRNWMTQIDIFTQNNNVSKILIGNKCDKFDRKISFEEGQDLADEFGMQFFETSAKDKTNINEIFYSITKQILQNKTK